MKKILILAAAFSLFSCKNDKKETLTVAQSTETTTYTMETKSTVYSFKVKDINGDTFDFETLKGKKILIVNTASKCGLTPQYELLQKVYEENKNNNFVIIGFPANNFGAQEPGTESEIATFCQKNYGVTFPMMSKISVKGDDIHSLYKFLTSKSANGLQDSEVEWNFQKYLIGEEGYLEKVVSPRVLPTDEEITNWIKA